MATKTIRKIRYITKLTLCLCFIKCISGQTITQMNSVYTTTLNNYNVNVRPIDDQAFPTNVSFLFSLDSIRSVNEHSGIFGIFCSLTLQWYDPRMVWDPLLYGGAYSISVPRQSVWKPEFSVMNSIQNVATFGSSGFNVKYVYDGTAIWFVRDKIETICDFDIWNYPFDSQTCTVKLSPIGLKPSEIRILTRIVDVSSSIEENVEWKHKSSALEIIEEDNSVTVDIKITIYRSSYFPYFLKLVLVLVLLFLNGFVFIVPADAGERVGFTITCLLILVVTIFLTGETMPSSGSSVTSFSIFVYISFIISASISMLSIANLRLYFRDQQKPVPKCLKKVVRHLKCMKTKPNGTQNSPEISSLSENVAGDTKYEIGKEEDLLKCNDASNMWRGVAKLIDRICFFGNGIVLIIIILVFIVIPLAKSR